MKENTAQLAETIRNIYLLLNKNYSRFLKLQLMGAEEVELNDIFNQQLINEYRSDKKKVENLLDGLAGKNELVFSDQFDFNITDPQKIFGAKLLSHGITRTAMRSRSRQRQLTVLSLGIGDGKTASNYANLLDLTHQDRLIGIDIHSHYLSQAVATIPNLSISRFDLNELASGSQLPLAEQSVDLAECAMVAHHIEQFEPLILEVKRILKVGGKFFYLDLIDKTSSEEIMHFKQDHQYPPFHGVEFFRDHFTIKETINRYLSLEIYVRVGPGIIYLEAQKENNFYN